MWVAIHPSTFHGCNDTAVRGLPCFTCDREVGGWKTMSLIRTPRCFWTLSRPGSKDYADPVEIWQWYCTQSIMKLSPKAIYLFKIEIIPFCNYCRTANLSNNLVQGFIIIIIIIINDNYMLAFCNFVL